ncbi:hypothetical protein OA07_21370 [Aphanizomenon flos-aquae 2012/KM1/D3]|nr:hypothetical protein OA07_21370 [Aphanizomenon flos-aquae 2012/KM1/D3]
MARQKARGKSEEGLGDFTFLYTVWFYCVHLLKSESGFTGFKDLQDLKIYRIVRGCLKSYG